MLRWILFTIVILCLDYYAFQSIKTVTNKKTVFVIYWILSIAVLLNLYYNLFTFNDSRGLAQPMMLAFGLVILSVSPKLIAFIVLLSEDVFRVGKSTLNFFLKTTEHDFFPGRRAFVSKMALGLAAIPFGSVLYGMMRGKYNYQVLNHTLYFDDLPEAFNGFKLTHISDIHSGSFDNGEKIAYGID